MDIKLVLTIIAIALILVGYIPYIIDTIKGNTRPHIFSFFLWSFITAIIFSLQLKAGGGIGAWVTFAIVCMMVVVLALSFKNGDRDIKKIDFLFLALGIIAIPIWLIADQPALSMILLSGIDMLGFGPTIRKSWVDPWSETLSLYWVTAIRHFLAIFALVEINLITVLSPLTWTIANGLFAILLIVRRKKLTKK